MPEPIWDRQLGKAEAFLLAEQVRDMRGDPRLTAWEEGFLSSIQLKLATYGAKALLTEKQVAVLEKLRAKVAAEPVADEDDATTVGSADDETPLR
jgi:hypothetical protein